MKLNVNGVKHEIEKAMAAGRPWRRRRPAAAADFSYVYVHLLAHRIALDSLAIDNQQLHLTAHDWSIRKRTLHGGLRDGIDLVEVDNGTSPIPFSPRGEWDYGGSLPRQLPRLAPPNSYGSSQIRGSRRPRRTGVAHRI